MGILDSEPRHRDIYTPLFRSVLFSVTAVVFLASGAFAADKLYAIYTAHSLFHVLPWIAQESGAFKKYDLEVPLI